MFNPGPLREIITGWRSHRARDSVSLSDECRAGTRKALCHRLLASVAMSGHAPELPVAAISLDQVCDTLRTVFSRPELSQ